MLFIFIFHAVLPHVNAKVPADINGIAENNNSTKCPRLHILYNKVNVPRIGFLSNKLPMLHQIFNINSA